MAARQAPKTVFEKELTRWIENLVFVYALTGVQWNSVESQLPEWTAEIRASRTAEELTAFVERELKPAVRGRADLVWDALYDTKRISPRLLKYLLAGITQYVEEQTGKGGAFDTYFKEKLTIEHILPQTWETPDWQELFAHLPDAGQRVHWLGNLTLLHAGPNFSSSNLSYEQKLKRYEKSTYDLTRSLATDIRYGKKGNATSKAVERLGLYPVASWSPEALDRRHQMMMTIVSEVWGVPLPGANLRPITKPESTQTIQDLSS